MTYSDELNSYLLSTPAITALVGDRIYPLHLPAHPAVPALTYQRISGPKPAASQSNDGPTHARVRITSWGRSLEDANAVAAAVIAALQSGGGPGLGHTKDGDQEDDEPATGLMRRRLEYLVFIDE